MTSQRDVQTVLKLRAAGIDVAAERILVSRLDDSLQERDLSLPVNCDGLGRIHHFRLDQGDLWPVNPLPVLPAAKALNLGAPEMMQAQVFQSAICSWRCWYCFVDYSLLKGDLKRSTFKSAGELLDLMKSEGNQTRLIDLSGGQPDLFPEWPLWWIRELDKRGLTGQYYIWSDDNLSNDFFWRLLKPKDIHDLASSPFYGRVGCFKGFDAQSFEFNTRAHSDGFEIQFDVMRRLIDSRIDVYAYVTLTTDDNRQLEARMAAFIDKLQALEEEFPLRVVPLRIRKFTPMLDRMPAATIERVLTFQEEALSHWAGILRKRFGDQALSRETIVGRFA